LRKRMPLEADPTIQYIIHDGPRRLYRSDLAIDSPYNTYRRTGLPPGPINSPGLRAIRAALNPADVDFIYFVAQGDGSHHFSSSYNDFLKAKQKLQALRRELAASRGSDG
ncbi:MAG: endolytic transglycosylase MltG, partial [Calditrichaeota bacterium]|nr:endolytic transglycosylase MltG [Calditrichota bacterium]